MTGGQKRRSEPVLTSEHVLQAALFHSVDWPWKTTRYERESLVDYLQRPFSSAVPVTELCHESTKLVPERVGELTASRLDVPSFRFDYIRRRAIAVAKSGPAPIHIDERVRAVVQGLYTTSSPELYYAIELRSVVDATVYSHEPMAGTMHLLKQLSAEEQASLERALAVMPSAPAIRPVAYLFVVGSFGRNELLFGNRGHRRTLLEAGQVTQAVIGACRLVGQRVLPIYDFTDREVDAVLEADGIEEGTLAVLGVLGGSRAS